MKVLLSELRNLFTYKEFIKLKVRSNVLIRYRRSILGFLWTILNPLIMMLILTAVFSMLMRAKMPDVSYSAFALTGILVFNFFSEATNGSAQSLVAHAELLKKIYIPKISLPVIYVLSAFVNFALSLIPLFIIYLFTGVHPGLKSFAAIIGFAELMIFSTGVGFILAPMAVFVRDLMYIYGLFLTALFYATPFFYPASIIPAKYRFLLEFNPLYYMLESIRTPLLFNVPAPVEVYFIGGIASIFTLLAGLFIFLSLENHIIPYM